MSTHRLAQPVPSPVVRRLPGSCRPGLRARRASLFLALGVWALLAACDDRPAPLPRPPNILVVVADDLGVNDVGAFGGDPALTPAIDAFAAGATRFTRFYTAAAVCAPTRASLLTGRHPGRYGFRNTPRGLPDEAVTLAERLRDAGYATHHVGKWHLGEYPARVRPLAQGFDTFYGFLHGQYLDAPTGPGYFDPMLMRDEDPPTRASGHLTDLLSEEAVRLIEEAPRDRPWLIELWYYAPHTPVQPAARFARHEPDTPEGRYRALVAGLDAGVGRVLAALEASGQADDTVVAFLSDNGAVEQRSNLPYLGVKTQLYEGSVRVPFALRVPGRTPPGSIAAVTSSLDVAPTLLALAGAEPLPEADGLDLAPLLDGGTLPARRLFWEAPHLRTRAARSVHPTPVHPEAVPTRHGMGFGVLGAEGRWRYAFVGRSTALFDLVADPTGTRNVIADHPPVAASLVDAFEAFEGETERIPVAARVHGDATWRDDVLQVAGAGWLEWTGYDVMRTPGLGGWTFSARLVLDEAAGASRVVAEQPGVFSLTAEPGGTLALALGDLHLEAPAPEPGRCTGLILSVLSLPHWSRDSRSTDTTAWLYLGGTLGGHVTGPLEIGAAALDAPTRIGGSPDRPGLVGTLLAPRLANAAMNFYSGMTRSAALCDAHPAAASTQSAGPGDAAARLAP